MPAYSTNALEIYVAYTLLDMLLPQMHGLIINFVLDFRMRNLDLLHSEFCKHKLNKESYLYLQIKAENFTCVPKTVAGEIGCAELLHMCVTNWADVSECSLSFVYISKE